MPYKEVSNYQIKRVLQVSQLKVFINLVKRKQLDLCAVSKALKAQLGLDRIAGSLIKNKKTLSIKTAAPLTIYKVEEVSNSKGNKLEVEGNNSKDSNKGRTLTPLLAKLRQLILIELFYLLQEIELLLNIVFSLYFMLYMLLNILIYCAVIVIASNLRVSCATTQVRLRNFNALT